MTIGGGRSGGSGFVARWVKRLAIWGAALALLGILALGTAVYFASRNLPSYNELKASQAGQTIVVRARDGSEIVALGPSYGQWLSSDEIPQVMKDAMVSVEDRRFYSHFGIDPIGLMRAVWVAFRDDQRTGRRPPLPSSWPATSSSTPTARSIARRVRRCWRWRSNGSSPRSRSSSSTSTRSISAAVPTASIPPAANSSAIPRRELSLGEAAIIAGLVKAPSRYSPTADVDAAVGRANVVIGQMRKYGAIAT